MSVQFGNGVPGIRSDRTYTPRIVLHTTNGAELLPGGKTIDGSKSRDPLNTGDLATLRPGMLMGKITSSEKYAPAVIGISLSATTASFTSIVLTAATAVELSRRNGATGTMQITGPESATGTVATVTATHSAINTTTGATTVAAVDGTSAFIPGSFIRPTDGSGTIKGILDEHVRVTDVDGGNLDCQMARLLTQGFVTSAQIINYPSNAVLITWLKGQLNAPSTGPGPFKFDDNF